MKLYGVIGYKNAGKTTLVERLVAEFTRRGLRVSTVKHAHHAFDLDQPGKDTFRHRSAGAEQVMLSTGARWVLMTELRDASEPELSELLPKMEPVDLVLVEGYKRDSHPKIEVWRAATGHPLIAPDDPTVRAVASDGVTDVDRPILELNDISGIADFIWAVVTKPGARQNKGPFDTFVMVDWGAGNDTGPTPRKDAIWIAEAGLIRTGPHYHRTRQQAETALVKRIETALSQGETLCVGFDFGFAYPEGFARQLTGTDDPFALWDWFEARVKDDPRSNNRFDIAGEINAKFDGIGPFWGNGLARDIEHLPRKGSTRTRIWAPAKRRCEDLAPGTFECWQLSGAGAVGSQIIMGLPTLSRLRKRFGAAIAVWPFEDRKAPVTLVEIWPSLIAEAVRAAADWHTVRDAVQVDLLACTCAVLGPDMSTMLEVPQTSEGWILGVGHEDLLQQAAQLALAERAGA